MSKFSFVVDGHDIEELECFSIFISSLLEIRKKQRDERVEAADVVPFEKPAQPGPTATPPQEVPFPVAPPETVDQTQTVPVQPAPAPQPAAAPVPENPVEVDKTGRPWDGRIDSSNRKKTAKGVWQKRKGVTPELITQVTAELMAGGAPTQPAAAPAPPPQQPGTPGTPAPPPPQPVTPSVDPTTITTLPLLIQYLETKGLAIPDIADTAAAVGCDNVAFLGTANYQHLIPTVVAELEKTNG